MLPPGHGAVKGWQVQNADVRHCQHRRGRPTIQPAFGRDALDYAVVQVFRAFRRARPQR